MTQYVLVVEGFERYMAATPAEGKSYPLCTEWREWNGQPVFPEWPVLSYPTPEEALAHAPEFPGEEWWEGWFLATLDEEGRLISVTKVIRPCEGGVHLQPEGWRIEGVALAGHAIPDGAEIRLGSAKGTSWDRPHTDVWCEVEIAVGEEVVERFRINQLGHNQWPDFTAIWTSPAGEVVEDLTRSTPILVNPRKGCRVRPNQIYKVTLPEYLKRSGEALPPLLLGETATFAAPENRLNVTVEGRHVNRVSDPVPLALFEVFPELGEAFVVEEVGGQGRRWLVEKATTDQWQVPQVTDLSTRQLAALLALGGGRVDGVDFCPSWSNLAQGATTELIRRSRESYLSGEATRWVAQHFDESWSPNCGFGGRPFVEWLGFVVHEVHNGLGRLPPDSAALRFAEKREVRGAPEEWGWLHALPSSRTAVQIEDGVARLPGGEHFAVRHCDAGWFREREDGSYDLFIRRGSREVGDAGWLWAHVEPVGPGESRGKTLACVDPLHNYAGFRELGVSPVADRVASLLKEAMSK